LNSPVEAYRYDPLSFENSIGAFISSFINFKYLYAALSDRPSRSPRLEGEPVASPRIRLSILISVLMSTRITFSKLF